MEGMPRRELLGKALRGLGLALAGLIPGGFFFTRRALGQNQAATPQKLSPAEVSRLTSTLAQTTKQNVIQVLNGSTLPEEDKLAVLAVRQLSPGEVRSSLDQMQRLGELAKREEGAGGICGSGCGVDCGRDCGNNCGRNCSFAPAPSATVAGAFCGGGCKFAPGTTGLVDTQGKLKINFVGLDVRRLQASLRQALGFIQ